MEALWSMAENNKEEPNYYKLGNSDIFYPLAIEILEKNEISICHYNKLNGDLMCNPEMVFIKSKEGKYYPIYYKNSFIGLEIFSASNVGDELHCINEKQQFDQALFADEWLNNIMQQQDLKIEGIVNDE